MSYLIFRFSWFLLSFVTHTDLNYLYEILKSFLQYCNIEDVQPEEEKAPATEDGEQAEGVADEQQEGEQVEEPEAAGNDRMINLLL